MSIIAQKNPKINVHVVDMNANKITAWNSENLPVYEPGLLKVVKEARGRNLFFSTDYWWRFFNSTIHLHFILTLNASKTRF